MNAVSVCLAWHATPLRDASGTALVVRALCVLVATPAGGLSDGWSMRTRSAPFGTGSSPVSLQRPAAGPQPVRTYPAMRKPLAGSHLDIGSIPAPPHRTGDRDDKKPRQVRHRRAQARRLG